MLLLLIEKKSSWLRLAAWRKNWTIKIFFTRLFIVVRIELIITSSSSSKGVVVAVVTNVFFAVASNINIIVVVIWISVLLFRRQHHSNFCLVFTSRIYLVIIGLKMRNNNTIMMMIVMMVMIVVSWFDQTKRWWSRSSKQSLLLHLLLASHVVVVLVSGVWTSRDWRGTVAQLIFLLRCAFSRVIFYWLFLIIWSSSRKTRSALRWSSNHNMGFIKLSMLWLKLALLSKFTNFWCMHVLISGLKKFHRHLNRSPRQRRSSFLCLKIFCFFKCSRTFGSLNKRRLKICKTHDGWVFSHNSLVIVNGASTLNSLVFIEKHGLVVCVELLSSCDGKGSKTGKRKNFLSLLVVLEWF